MNKHPPPPINVLATALSVTSNLMAGLNELRYRMMIGMILHRVSRLRICHP